jgi:hypothetical protein
VIRELAGEIAQLGRFNFLMSDSQHLYAHCSTSLYWIQRRAPFTRAALIDADLEVDFSEHTTPKDKVVVVATRPLTRNESWAECRPGDFLVFGEGERLHGVAGGERSSVRSPRARYVGAARGRARRAAPTYPALAAPAVASTSRQTATVGGRRAR